jgi:hypothetical protein
VSPEENQRFYNPYGLRFGSGTSGAWSSYANIAVGPFTWGHAPVFVADEDGAKGSSLAFQGNLGVYFLRNFRVSVDMKTPRLWLAQTVPFRDREHVTTYGFTLAATEGDRVIVSSMDRQGPAAQAGLKAGDLVSKINGMDSMQVMSSIQSLLSDPLVGEKIHLTLGYGFLTKDLTIAAEAIP